MKCTFSKKEKKEKKEKKSWWVCMFKKKKKNTHTHSIMIWSQIFYEIMILSNFE